MHDNKDKSRFEHAVGAHTVFADYDRRGDTLVIKYVEAPEPLRGTGAAGQLMEDIFAYARAEGLKVYPICGYAVSWARRHPEIKHLISVNM